MMDKIVACLSKTETFYHFAFLKNTIATANKIPLLWCFVYLGFGWGNVATVVSSMPIFVRTFMQAFTAE